MCRLTALGPTWMNPVGGEILDKMISSSPESTSAVNNNNITTIHRMLKDAQNSLNTIAPHITHTQLRTIAAERIDAFGKLVTCIHKGKCGFSAHFRSLCSSIDPIKISYSSVSD